MSITDPALGPGPQDVRERRPGPFVVLMLLAVAAGLFIGWMDSRPTWDDAGITAGTLFLTAALFGAVRPSRAPFLALAVGAGVPLFGIVLHRNLGSLIAPALAFFGAYAGALVRRVLAPPGAK